MFSTITVLVASAVAAQAASSASASASASAASSTANPYIPSGISAACTTYLTGLNTDTDLTPCTSALMTATSAFGPGGNSTASKSDISTALTSICSTSTTDTCSQSLLTGKLASFYSACGPELTSSPNTEVKTIYDTMYALQPLLQAVCSKDDTGAWCATQANASTADATLSPAVKASANARRADSVTAYMPNATAINDNNILFMFLTAALPKASLCTTCTRNILSAYMQFESATNYAPGLAQSVLMSGQTALYSGIVSTCGSDFLSGAVKAAGSLGQGTGSSGALPLRAGSVLAMLVGSLATAALLL
ncbi:hypothetical protein DFH06DRAFT_1102109 [Mycena polygramma]|nr:hypothetical protein DFH06DRAFT_1102109 [Mycena polygramma]